MLDTLKEKIAVVRDHLASAERSANTATENAKIATGVVASAAKQLLNPRSPPWPVQTCTPKLPRRPRSRRRAISNLPTRNSQHFGESAWIAQRQKPVDSAAQ